MKNCFVNAIAKHNNNIISENFGTNSHSTARRIKTIDSECETIDHPSRDVQNH